MAAPWRDIHWSIWLLTPVLFYIFLFSFSVVKPELYLMAFEGDSWLFELLVSLIPFIAAAIGLLLLLDPVVRQDRFMALWVAFIVIGLVLVAFEDIGWGRDILDIPYPDWWPGDTMEEGHVVDPRKEALRTLLSAFVVICGIGFPVFNWIHPAHMGQPGFFRIIWPTYVCIPVLVFSVLSQAPRSFAEDKLHIRDDAIRHSEVGEMFIYVFALVYVFSLYQRLIRSRPMAS